MWNVFNPDFEFYKKKLVVSVEKMSTERSKVAGSQHVVICDSECIAEPSGLSVVCCVFGIKVYKNCEFSLPLWDELEILG